MPTFTQSDKNKSFFALLLWYAVRTGQIQIDTQADGTTVISRVLGQPPLGTYASALSPLGDENGVTALISSFEQGISTGFSSNLYPVKLQDGTITNASVNYGVGLKTVGELADNLLWGDYGLPTLYTPRDPSCTPQDVISVSPGYVASTAVRRA